MKEGRKETKSGVEVGPVKVSLSYNSNKQTKKLGVDMQKHSNNHNDNHNNNHNNNYALKFQTCHSHYDAVRTVTKKKTMYIACRCGNEKIGTKNQSRSDKLRETHRLRKKQKRQIKKKPTDSGKSRSNKSRKTHRLRKKQKRQIKKKTWILKQGTTRAEIPNLLSTIRTFQDTETKTDRRSCSVFDKG